MDKVYKFKQFNQSVLQMKHCCVRIGLSQVEDGIHCSVTHSGLAAMATHLGKMSTTQACYDCVRHV